MRYFQPKQYQTQVLDSITAYFRACHALASPSLAFTQHTQTPYNPLSGFASDMPYFCLRIPTGGGKTWLAAESVALINQELLHSDYSVILWLVPSNPIKDQTLKGLKDREHPLHAALCKAGAVSVLSLDEAKSVTPATLNTSTTIIVATRQAFQVDVDNEEKRKVYEGNGALMAHFDGITHEQRRELLKEKNSETIPFSLANVLRLYRPFIIVDEAHNNRTELGFDTLAKFNPSGIMELTATPDLEKTPSNVLHSVSAVELKNEQMIKLPIFLRTEPNWQQCLAYALTQRNDLQVIADREYRQGGNYLRPVVLIQAQPRKTGIETLDVEAIKQELISNHAIPPEEIIIATGEEKGLLKINADYPLGISDKNCPVKFIITQKALAEGWDCPFAYILVSMANIHSTTAVEQLLGRILRQPDASHRRAAELNQSYAFVVSSHFTETANALKDSLVKGAGFERKVVTEFVKPSQPYQGVLPLDRSIQISPIHTALTESPRFDDLPKTIREKISWHAETQTLTVHAAALTIDDVQVLQNRVEQNTSKAIIEQVAQQSRNVAIEFFQTPAERGVKLRIPQLAVYVQGELQLFDDPAMLDYPWDLSRYLAKPSDSDVNRLSTSLSHAAGKVDINEQGKLQTSFMTNLQRSLDLVYQPEHCDEISLAAWLCRNIHHKDVIHTSKLAFVSAWLNGLIARFSLVEVNQQKFLVRNLLEQHINQLREQAIQTAYQNTLLNDKQAVMTDNYAFEFPLFYATNRYYEGKYGIYDFQHHYYGQIGDFDSKEEFHCACYLDQLAEQKKIVCWLRNVARGNGAFFLQKATGKFYPDFVCLLPNDSILVVEYKGADRWKEADDDRQIGQLWAELSAGKCLFVMVTKEQFFEINAVISRR